MPTSSLRLSVLALLLLTACAQGSEGALPASGKPADEPCTPSTSSCEADVATVCSPTGKRETYACDATQGMWCDPDGCKGACSHESLGSSYLGCDFYPTQTPNAVWSGFSFAVAVANTADVVAHVTLTRGSQTIETRTVAANSLALFTLPWVPELKGGDFGTGAQLVDATGATSIVADGAYRVRSDQPVTAYQYNALEYQMGGGAPGCPGAADGSGGCFSYSNDASLLLPVNAWGTYYTTLLWPSKNMQGGDAGIDASGFIAITAAEDDTRVELEGVIALTEGAGLDATGKGSVYLDAGDVLRVIAAPGDPPEGFGATQTYGADLSGGRVVASKRVEVTAGNRCAFVPEAATGYCDHLEEVMFPIETLGSHYVVTSPAGAASGRWPYVLRVAATEPDTTVHFDPPIAPDTVLGPDSPPISIPGVMVDVEITASHPVLVAEYMHGATSVPDAQGQPSSKGDPAEVLAVPVEQFRNETLFLASTTYDENWVNVIAPAGASVTLDGTAVPASSFEAVGGSGLAVARQKLSAVEVHAITSDQPIGLLVYGYGEYTSYMVPGGLDLAPINVPPPR